MWEWVDRFGWALIFKGNRIAHEVDIPVILVGGFRNLDTIETILYETDVQAISMSRQLIREPDLVKRWMETEKKFEHIQEKMKTIEKCITVLTALVLSLTANATASEFIYKPASKTIMAVNMQKVEGGHLERFKKPFEVQRLSKSMYGVSVANYNVTVLVGEAGVLLIDAPIHAGKRVLKAIEAIIDKPLRGIVYSHVDVLFWAMLARAL